MTERGTATTRDELRNAVVEAARAVVALRRPNWPKEMWSGVRANEMGDLEAALMRLDAEEEARG